MRMDLPHEDERLFQLDEDYKNNACLSPYWSSLARYGENYKEAADSLVISAINGKIYVDTIVYPVVFLYRQYLELTLKDIIFRTRYIEHEGKGFPKTHRLKDLWAETKRLLQKHYGAEIPKEIAYLDQCFDEFQKHDPDSMAFRYPFDKSGNKHLMNLSHINVRHLMETMGRIGYLLSCIANDIEYWLQLNLEMENEFRP